MNIASEMRNRSDFAGGIEMSFKVPVKEKNGTMKANRKRVICQDHESRHALIMANAGSLLTSAVLLAEKAFPHHGAVNCYDHSIFVAEKSLLLAQKLRLKIDARSLIRGALLHDLYLYDWHIPDPEHPHRLHGFFHPARALRNAAQHFELNALEKDIIRKHMFPLTIIPPVCRESWLVCVADTICAVQEWARSAHVRGVPR